MNKSIVVGVLLLFAAGMLWGQAQFSEVNGKVEIRPASGGAWQAAEVGMTVDEQTMISTGFNSSAELQMGASTVSVEQLTRMVFEEIVERSDSVETRMNLSVGKMSAQVRSSDGRAQDFQVRSPISTAAVRGTDFEFDGEQLRVTEGIVAFVNNYGQQRRISVGQKSQITEETTTPTDPVEEAQEDTTTSTEPIGAGSDDEKEAPQIDTAVTPAAPRSTRGTLTIQVR